MTPTHPMSAMRLIFAGTPAVANASLDTLVRAGHDVAAVITRNDAPLGRKRVLSPSAVGAHAAAIGLNTIKANRLDETVTDEVAALQPDLGVIVAYGGLVREPLLSTPRLGWINLHFSLLPAWRGAAPVQRAIAAGDAVSGVSVFQLVPELDAGAIFGTRTRTIGAHETASELLGALAEDGSRLLASVVADLAAGTAVAKPQVGEPSAAPKLTLDDARLRWDQPADAVYNALRAVTDEPGAFTTLTDARLKVLSARPAPDSESLPPGRFARIDSRILVGTATHPLELYEVQPAGKRPMHASDWWRGLGADPKVVAS